MRDSNDFVDVLISTLTQISGLRSIRLASVDRAPRLQRRVAMSGPAALSLWTSSTPAALGLEAPDAEVLWARLNDPSVPHAVDAARSLLSYTLFAK